MYCYVLGRSKEEFYNATLGETVWAIMKHSSREIEEKNILIGLFRSIGSKYPYIKKPSIIRQKKNDTLVDSFDDML